MKTLGIAEASKIEPPEVDTKGPMCDALMQARQTPWRCLVQAVNHEPSTIKLSCASIPIFSLSYSSLASGIRAAA